MHHACQWLALPFPSALTLVVVILQWRKLLDSEAVVDKLVEQVGVQLCCWMAELLVDRIGEPQQQLSSLQAERRSVCNTRQAELQPWLGGCWSSSAGGTCRQCRSRQSVLPLRSQQQRHSLAVRRLRPQSRCTPSDAPLQRQKGRLLCTLSRSAVLQGIRC